MTTKNNPDMVTVPKIQIYGVGDIQERFGQFEFEGNI